jgi:hypothetical protein
MRKKQNIETILMVMYETFKKKKSEIEKRRQKLEENDIQTKPNDDVDALRLMVLMVLVLLSVFIFLIISVVS